MQFQFNYQFKSTTVLVVADVTPSIVQGYANFKVLRAIPMRGINKDMKEFRVNFEMLETDIRNEAANRFTRLRMSYDTAIAI